MTDDGRREVKALITPGVVSGGEFLPAGVAEEVQIVMYDGDPDFSTIRLSPGGIETVTRAGWIASRYGAARVDIGQHGVFVMEVTWLPTDPNDGR